MGSIESKGMVAEATRPFFKILKQKSPSSITHFNFSPHKYDISNLLRNGMLVSSDCEIVLE